MQSAETHTFTLKCLDMACLVGDLIRRKLVSDQVRLTKVIIYYTLIFNSYMISEIHFCDF